MDFKKLHHNLSRLKQNLFQPYGGLNLVFAGDYRQLEPVGNDKRAIYKTTCPEMKHWMNCYLELNGMHRFKMDREWGQLLQRFRNGTATKEDVTKVNERIVQDGITTLPEDLRYATYFNRDRDAINTALFEKRCEHVYNANGNTDDSLIILCDGLEAQYSPKTYKPFKNKKLFWESCGEDDVKPPRTAGRMDPVLRVYKGCRLMLPSNNDVKQGQANGTQVFLERVVLKPGETPNRIMINGQIPINTVFANQVDHLILKHSNNRIQPAQFSVRPQKYNFKARFPTPESLRTSETQRDWIQMRGVQLPVLVNNTTTGHKLQGSGINNLFVHNWSYVTNWAYVMLSRVKTHKGLYCRKPLSYDLKKYAIPPGLTRMLRGFEQK